MCRSAKAASGVGAGPKSFDGIASPSDDDDDEDEGARASSAESG